MSRSVNSKSDKDIIYEIYSACRLCGSREGYKMPIIQNVVDLDNFAVELRHKIRDCLQIQVSEGDKMPPLICDRCSDKVDDFYEFLQLCKQTNTNTRKCLGLPLETESNNKATSAPIKTEDEPLSRLKSRIESTSSNVNKKCNSKDKRKLKKIMKKRSSEIRRSVTVNNDKDYQKRVKKETEIDKDRVSRSRSRSSSFSIKSSLVSPPSRLTRQSANDDLPLSLEANKKKEGPKPILKKEKDEKDGAPLKRCIRELSQLLAPVPTKKVKIVSPPITKTSSTLSCKICKRNFDSKRSLINHERIHDKNTAQRNNSPPITKASPKFSCKICKKIFTNKRSLLNHDKIHIQRTAPSTKNEKEKEPEVPSRPQLDLVQCEVCKNKYRIGGSYATHLKTHAVTTCSSLVCNACGEWFTSNDSCIAHHRMHKTKNMPYKCARCEEEFQSDRLYDEHMDNNACSAWYVVPDVKCDVCWQLFATETLLQSHRCPGESGRCGVKSEIVIEDDVKKRLLDMSVKLVKCDTVLRPNIDNRYDVSNLPPGASEQTDDLMVSNRRPWTPATPEESQNFALDHTTIYPYLYEQTPVKRKSSLQTNAMVTIKTDIKDLLQLNDDCGNWDSDISCDDDRNNGVEKLSTIARKVIHANKSIFLGKTRRKKKKLTDDDSYIGNEFSDDDVEMTNVTKDINIQINEEENIFDNKEPRFTGFPENRISNETNLGVSNKSLDISNLSREDNGEIRNDKEMEPVSNFNDKEESVNESEEDIDQSLKCNNKELIDPNSDSKEPKTDDNLRKENIEASDISNLSREDNEEISNDSEMERVSNSNDNEESVNESEENIDQSLKYSDKELIDPNTDSKEEPETDDNLQKENIEASDNLIISDNVNIEKGLHKIARDIEKNGAENNPTEIETLMKDLRALSGEPNGAHCNGVSDDTEIEDKKFLEKLDTQIDEI